MPKFHKIPSNNTLELISDETFLKYTDFYKEMDVGYSSVLCKIKESYKNNIKTKNNPKKG